MRLIKEKVKHKGEDIHLPLRLTANSNLNGLQQAVNDFIEDETGLSINPVTDIDTFRYLPENTDEYKFYFYSGVSWYNSYEAAGFTTGETASRSEVVARSFFLVQLYNVFETENQRLLHNGYYNGFNFLADEFEGNSTQPDYSLSDFTEFTNFYIPNDFITSLSGVTTTVYGKLSFYNAKTGKLQLFYPTGGTYTDPPTGDTGLYVEYQVNPTGKTYTMTAVTGFKEFIPSDYTDKINNTIDSFNNQKPSYPTGNTFLNTGQYIED